jgi:hypothetical protein
MLPSSISRVPENTADHVNRDIREETTRNVSRFEHSTPQEIDRRIDELEHEWDIERTIEANAATLALTGLALGTFVDRRWYALSAVVGTFLLQHALQGWCPPVPVFRRMGYRTIREIEIERDALKLLRGDYNIDTSDVSQVMEAARR